MSKLAQQITNKIFASHFTFFILPQTSSNPIFTQRPPYGYTHFSAVSDCSIDSLTMTDSKGMFVDLCPTSHDY